MNRYDFLHASLRGSAVLYSPHFVSVLVAARYFKHSRIRIVKGKLEYPKGGKVKQIVEYTPANGWFWVRTQWLQKKIKHKRLDTKRLKNEAK